MRKLLLLCVSLSTLSPASVVFLPHSRHPQFLTYGLFTEEQTTFVFENSNRAWAAIGDSIALVEAEDLPGKPQLVVNGSVNFGFRNKGSLLDFNVETLDARFAFFIELALSPQWRLSIGGMHVSGHAGDGILDPSLVAPNLGDNLFQARLIRDVDTRFRLGGTIKTFTDMDPSGKHFAVDQFGEWFPWGAASGPVLGGQPYLAIGLEEYGWQQYDFTYHVQAGLLFGNHFGPEKTPALRLVGGYYHGVDPRLKYAVFQNAHVDFLYFGVMLNL